MSEQQAAYVAPVEPKPEFAVIEILERPGDPDSPVVPNEIRINGVPLYSSADEPITVSPISISGDNELVTVTVSFVAKRVFIGQAEAVAR